MSKRVPVMLLIVLFGVLPALADQSAHVVVSPDTLKWAEPPILPGAKLAVVQGDPSKEGPFVYRLKMPAGYKVPPHFHKAAENVTVLTGVFYLGLGEKFDQGSGQELPVGGFVSVPPKHPHYAWAGPQETVVQVHGVGPTDLTFVNPADDPRKK
jgi:quercetin dioxygenase-like cupin family protein